MQDLNHIEYLINWLSYYHYLVSPMLNMIIDLAFDCIVLQKIYNLIKELYKAKIEIK